jgi:hypothetical protein
VIETVASLQGEFTIEFAKSANGDLLFTSKQMVYLNGKGLDTLNEPKKWVHTLQSFDRDTYLKISDYVNTTMIPLVWIRYGIVAGGQGKMTDWEAFTIVDLHAIPRRTGDSGHGDQVMMVTSDLLYAMQKDARVASRKGKISDMAQTMAQVAGFQKFSVEPTDLDYALVQSYESDFDFLTRRMIPMASNKESSSNYIVYSRGGLFHFHTLNFQLSGVFNFDYGVFTNTSTNLRLANVGNNNGILAVNGVNLVAYDPLDGTATNWQTKPEREVILSNTAPDRSGTTYLVAHVGQNQLASLYAQSQLRYAQDKNSAYELSMTVENYPFIAVADVVNVTIVRGQGDPWEGLYMVKSATHVVQKATVTSVYSLTRGEFMSDNGSAEGKKLSVDGLQSSSLTSDSTGSFVTGGGGTIVDVIGPDD